MFFINFEALVCQIWTMPERNASYFAPFLSLGLLTLFLPLAFSPWEAGWFTATKFTCLYAGSILVLASVIGSQQTLIFPRLSRQAWMGGVMALLFVVVSISVNWPTYSRQVLLNSLCFLGLGLVTYGLAKMDARLLWRVLALATLVSSVFLAIYGMCQLFGIEAFLKFQATKFPATTFGDPNFAAEFYGAALLCLVFLFLDERSKALRSLAFITAGVLFCLIYFTGCRAVWVAVLLVFILISFTKRVFKNIFSLILFSSFLVVSVSWVRHQQPSKYSELSKIEPTQLAVIVNKLNSIDLRLYRWTNSLVMMKDHPFGIGPTGFEFGYMSYERALRYDGEGSEEKIIEKVHNELLEIFLQYGWIVGVLFLSFLFVIFRFLFRIRRRSSLDLFLFSEAIYLLVISLFAFPGSNPYPFFLSSVLLGFIVSRWEGPQLALKRWMKRCLLTGLIAGILNLGSFFTYSKIVQLRDPNDLKVNQRACTYFPDNWRVCLRAAELYDREANFEAASSILNDLLAYHPNNFLALRMKVFLELHRQNITEACFAYFKYDHLFYGRSSLTKDFADLCKS